jgi:hypothetical protein
VPDYAPDGRPYLFLLTVPNRPHLYEILCFVARAAGFSGLSHTNDLDVRPDPTHIRGVLAEASS